MDTKNKGFSLVELVITIAIMSIALLGVAFSLQFSADRSADPLIQSKTVELVQAYSEEILTKRFDELTPVGGVPACTSCTAAVSFGADSETRGGGVNTFDDVDDYHGIDEVPVDAQGNTRSEYQGYRVQIAVSYAGTALGLASDQYAKEITITVTPPTQEPLEFSVYRGNF
ncbi:MAG: prepilin-type N-terminal cleavage/methylation domain-containing protein [Motiliproteus sp.]|nr:prepilin-type N-terminal cleavage/methylation domain-containing protein [Motiliproteus sp.]MCW9050886.1 prepilin-type N-terminal cleavage/methylation domain-containing protein [Motiliproteus sp.]